MSTLKVYFTAATSYNGELHRVYTEIVSELNKQATVLSGEQIVDKKKLQQDSRLTSADIYRREFKKIERADCVIAEVSRPSLGVGAEIDYALSRHKPVLSLIHEGYETRISPIIKGNTSEFLYLEYYTPESLPFKINHFMVHLDTMKRKKGKLIVIDGGDGSGKTTQAGLLVTYLKSHHIPVRYFDFPQYYHTFHGKTVARFLRGEFGALDAVSPYLASLAYALDRASVKDQMVDFLTKGGYIIANRYATSNFAHQGSKFPNEAAQKEFINWDTELEYKIHKIPKEDLVIYLHVPWRVGAKLTGKRAARLSKGKRKRYS
ncbi:nucleoside 2-deoxyribosyltransferase [Candidatus Roizmanbacteria bacterium]|nr:nucleoside 2-deoxyribosyltransferase [Candidatus Roizmanbacteria bacterium]